VDLDPSSRAQPVTSGSSHHSFLTHIRAWSDMRSSLPSSEAHHEFRHLVKKMCFHQDVIKSNVQKIQTQRLALQESDRLSSTSTTWTKEMVPPSAYHRSLSFTLKKKQHGSSERHILDLLPVPVPEEDSLSSVYGSKKGV
jgi:hypothetical protein